MGYGSVFMVILEPYGSGFSISKPAGIKIRILRFRIPHNYRIQILISEYVMN
jgi:hypothetical protein